MYKFIKLSAISLLLIGCKGMYDDNTHKMKKGNDSTAHVQQHINSVTQNAAARASETSAAAAAAASTIKKP